MTHVLKPYPARKDSGLEWLGEVPEHWEIRRLKNVAEMRISNVDKHTKEGEYPVRLCNYVDVYKNDHISPSMLFMRATATADEIARFRLTPGDVLITKDSEAWDDIGVPALVVESADDLVSGYHLALLRPLGTCLNGGYLLRALQSRSIGCQFHVQANGVTRYGLSHAAIQSVWLLLPPLPEQAAISYFVDYADRRIQHYIRAKEKLIALLDEYRQTIIDQAVTGQIDVRTGEPYPAYKDSGVEWLGQVPEHWEVRRGKLLFHCVDVRSNTGDEELLTVSSERGVVPRSSASVTMFKAESYIGYKLCWPNDLVINSLWAWSGGLGLSRYHGIVSSAYGVYRLQHRYAISPDYIHRLVRSTSFNYELRLRSKGIWISRLQLTDEAFLQAPFPVPPLLDQIAIVRFLDRATAKMGAAIDRAGRQIDLVKEYRSRLIADVVTGKLDVRGAAATLPEVVDPLAGDDVDDPLDPEVDSALEDLESRTEVII